MRIGIRILLIGLVLALVPSWALAAKTHRVKKTESLYALAKKYHVTVEELKRANNLVGNQVKSGDVIVIPPRTMAAAVEEPGGEKSTTYKAKKGDTLTRIAKKTGVSVTELRRLNGLRGNRVKPGAVLALQETGASEVPAPKSLKRYALRNSDLFSEKEYEQSLAELTESVGEGEVDLSKSVELRVDNVKLLKKTAYSFLGARYRFGGSSRRALDCSSFVQQVFREMEVSLPRTAREQFGVGNEVLPGDLQKGDLVFFRTYAHFPSHVGIYIEDDLFAHASVSFGVTISSLESPYYRERFVGARRIIK